ncbi:MAG: calcium/sodium antiporter [Casimicrobiaceae bacterium]
MTALLFIAGLITLVIGAELLVRGASKLALSAGISPLVVGLTVVAFGTGAPEAAVSVSAALEGQADVAVGNVIGSNILNVLLILGLSAVIAPLVVNMQLIRQEVPVMLGASVLFVVMAFDGRITVTDGTILLAAMVGYTIFLIVQSRRETAADPYAETLHSPVDGEARRWDEHLLVQIMLIAVGLALLVLGAQWLVNAAVTFARALGVSDLIIGLTIVAAGTSLPEIATSVMAALRGERDIAAGNVIGSNTFNIFGCLGLSSLASGSGLVVPEAALNFDLWVMLAVAVACLPVFISGREIARWEGAVFLGYYAVYVAYLILAAQSHDALPVFSSVMLSFVVPITIITLVVTLLPKPKAAAAPKGLDHD